MQFFLCISRHFSQAVHMINLEVPMKRSVSLLIALTFPLLTTLPLQAQAPKAKAVAKKAAKQAAKVEKKDMKAKPAKAEAKKTAAPAKADKAAKANKPVKANKAAKANSKPAKADPADCPCMKHVAKLEAMLAFHQSAIDVYKKDPVLKIKDFKGKARKAYKRRVRAEKAFHKGMAKQLKKKIRFFKKESRKCQMPKLMSEAPDEVKKILKERKAMLKAKRDAALK